MTGDHAGHREAPGSVRARRPWHRGVPGRRGTAEEILYILGILLHPDNAEIPFPLIFTGPETSREYFVQINQFITTRWAEAQQRYKIIIDDPELVAREMLEGITRCANSARRAAMRITSTGAEDRPSSSSPFQPTHENMRNLSLHKNQPAPAGGPAAPGVSGVVAGNVKDEGIRAIESTATSRSTATNPSPARWTRCWPRSWRSTA
jgi:hypothetical protein